MRAELAVAIALLVAGCTPVEMRGEHGAERVCHNEPAERFVGRPGEAGVIEGARKASGAATVRVLRPGEMATMDFRPDRLTIVVDGHRVIERASCG